MKFDRLDRISVAGLAVGVLVILLGQVFEGGHLSSLIQPTAFFIVIGGTLGAVMLQSPLPVFRAAMRMGSWVFQPPLIPFDETINMVVHWARAARKEGLLSLEGQLPRIKDPFLAKGLQLLVDGADPERMREILEVEIDTWHQQIKLCAKVWEAAGGYAPTVGILGAVMGLIHVMENLSDPSKLGGGIAVAFVATIYGVASANLIFLPIAKKLGSIIQSQLSLREMFLDGLVGVANGQNPRIIENRLRAYVLKEPLVPKA